MRPREVPVGAEARHTDGRTVGHGERRVVTGHELCAAGLVLAGVAIVENTGQYKVAGTVVEAVDLEVETLHPVGSGKRQLEGVYTFGRQADGRGTVGSPHQFRHHVGLAVDVGSIDKRLGVAELDVPFGAQQDECHTGRELTHLGVVVAILVVVAHTGVQDERAPLVLQLQISVNTVLLALSGIVHQRRLGKRLFEVVAYLVAQVVQLEVVVFNAEADIALVMAAQGVGIVTLELETVVLFLTINIAEEAAVGAEHLQHL